MRLPSSPIRVCSRDRPAIDTLSSAKRALKLKALPVRRLQARQWHTEIRTGSPAQVAESWPQEHSARRVVMEGSVLASNFPPSHRLPAAAAAAMEGTGSSAGKGGAA